jgi:Uma2 family endonuclease
MSLSMSILPGHFPTSVSGEPAWELATLFPSQGAWTVDQYLELTDSTNRLIEFTDGRIEVLEMPTLTHQRILTHLFLLMYQFVTQRQLGEVLFAGLRVQLNQSTFREPDIVFLHKDRKEAATVGNRYWAGSDLVLEIVSDDPGSRERDLVQKRGDYSTADIPEYWIVDPAEKRITVLVLEEGVYRPLGEFVPGQKAHSRVLDGFSVDVADVFRSADG